MTLYYKTLDIKIEIDETHVNTLVIENRNVFFNFLKDLASTLKGADDAFMLSHGGEIISPSKHIEIVSNFFDLAFNEKKIESGILANMKEILHEDKYSKTLSEIQRKISNIYKEMIFDSNLSIKYEDLDPYEIIKLTKFTLEPESENKIDILLNYIMAKNEFEKKDIFILINTNPFFYDEELESLVVTCLYKKIHIILLTSCDNKIETIPNRKQIIDEDLCVI